MSGVGRPRRPALPCLAALPPACGVRGPGDDEPAEASDDLASAALEACRRAGAALLRDDLRHCRTRSDSALWGIAAREAEGALLDLDCDPADASTALLGALADEWIRAYLAN